MNINSKVLPNFIKGITIILFAGFGSASFAEHHSMLEKKADKKLEVQEGIQVEEMDLEIAPLSEEELMLKAEKEKRMDQMKEMMSDEAKPETSE